MPEIYRVADAALVLSAIASLGVGLTDWGAKGSIGGMCVLLLAPVVASIAVWLRRTEWGQPAFDSHQPSQ